MNALIGGVLEQDASGCLVIGHSVILWPEGYSARRTATAAVDVFNSIGQRVATTGQKLSAGGGLADPTLTGPCLTGREVFGIGGPVEPIGG